MFAQPTLRTLWEDWRHRRGHLAGATGRPEQCRQVQIQILDYLIRRYRDAPEAARPARAPLRSGLFVNERAIVVHHHVWEDRVSGVKSEREAGDRVASILQRMQSPSPEDASDAPPDFTAPSEPTLGPEWYDAQQSRHARRALRAIQFNLRALPAIEAALSASPFLLERAVRHLYDLAADLGAEDRRAAELLVGCENRSALKYALVAWRKRVEAGRLDDVTELLEAHFGRPEIRDRAGDTIRLALADDHARVRLRAIGLLGAMGTLDDVGLLSDLLSLPPKEDEHPQEREALVKAMRQLAEGG